MSSKFIVIGLDGVTLNLLGPLIEQGKMPNIGRYIAQGSHGKLQSTYPPMSPTAWTSFMTGKNPGKHGIFDFLTKPYGTYYLEPAISSDIGSMTMWEYMGLHDKKVAAINIPMTYPPTKVNGIMVSGLGTPGDDCIFTYPEDLRQELNDNIGEYIIETRVKHYDKSEIGNMIADLKHMTKKRYEAGKYLLEREDWDLFTLVFVGPDRIQHCLWQYLGLDGQENMSEEDKEISDIILDYYHYLDSLIGRLLSGIDRNTNVIFLSDHGFGPLRKRINLNNWLIQQGYLKLTDNVENAEGSLYRLAKTVLKGVGIDKRRLQGFLNKLHINIDMHQYLEKRSLTLGKIDWKATKAFSYYCNSVFINLEGREREGIVRDGNEYEELCGKIIDHLYSLVDHETGKRIVNKVSRKEEIYSGEYLKAAPDLIITDYDERYWFGYFGEDGMYLDKERLDVFENDPWHTGQHTLQGMFIANGEHFKNSFRFDNANIMDLFPTISYLLDIPLPDDLDGRVLTEIIQEKSLDKEIIMKKIDPEQKDNYKLSDKEREGIKDQLKGLGYM